MSRRVVVAGTGVFGTAVASELTHTGVAYVRGSRHGGDVHIDVEDADSLWSVLRSGDIVIDTAGPFPQRTTTLIDTAAAVGCDVIDLNESVAFARRVTARHDDCVRAGIRVLSACSAVAVLSSALAACAPGEPEAVHVVVAPATRSAASAGTTRTLLESVGARIICRRGGRLAVRRSWAEMRQFDIPGPWGPIVAGNMESADCLLLPQAWPRIRDVDFWVEPGFTGARTALRLASGARLGALARSAPHRPATWLGRQAGRRRGAFAVCVETRGHAPFTAVLWRDTNSHHIAAVPAAAAAAALASGEELPPGVVPPHRQLTPGFLFDALKSAGVHYADSLGRTSPL